MIWLSERDACERLNCGWRGLQALTKSKLIVASGKQNGQTYRLSHIDKLQRRLIHPVEIRVRLGLKSRHGLKYLVKRLEPLGLRPISAGFYARKEFNQCFPQQT